MHVPRKNQSLIEEIDSLIKHYGAFVTSGFVTSPIGDLPNSFVEAAQTAAHSLRDEILNIGGFLVRADNEMVVRQ